MKKHILIITLMLVANMAYSQKPVIDTSVFGKWPYIQNVAITNNGEFVFYIINDQLLGQKTLTVKSLKNSWKKEFAGIMEADFTDNGKQIVYSIQDTVFCLTLGTDSLLEFNNINSFKLSNSKWLALEKRSSAGEIELVNLEGGDGTTFKNATDFDFDSKSNYLLIANNDPDTKGSTSLRLINLNSLKDNLIYLGKNDLAVSETISNFVFDPQGDQLAFIVKTKVDNQYINSLWYYKSPMLYAKKMVSDTSITSDGFSISENGLEFSSDGNTVFFNVLSKNIISNKSGLDVWSYIDNKLQSEQKEDIKRNSINRFAASLRIQTGFVCILEDEKEKLVSELGGFNIQRNGDVAITIKRNGSHGEWNWNKTDWATINLRFLNNGLKTTICQNVQLNTPLFKLSPDGNYILYYMPKEKNFFSYNIRSGTSTNLTKNISTDWTNDSESPQSFFNPAGVVTWLDDSSVLVYDRFKDIWLIKLSDTAVPKNLTDYYGRRNNTEFLFQEMLSLKDNNNKKSLLLLAQNKTTQKWSFCTKILNSSNSLTFLKNLDGISYVESKTSDQETFLIKNESATDCPNYFITNDFKTYHPVTDLHPEKKYNWIKPELQSWWTFNKKKTFGVLFKPENFDSTKKYPVIFQFYENESWRINLFNEPGATRSFINIPYFVSNGYLVFVPDIHYTLGMPGPSAFDYVVSAAKYLSRYRFIDASKMAIQSQSWGGYEINYIISHTNIFAAASSSAGIVNFTSSYGELRSGGYSNEYLFEHGQNRLGATLWEKPDLYIKNSPVFEAHKITTPLLLVNNKGDDVVSFQQGLQLFLGLRRMGKRTWMLQYDKGGHGVSGKDAIDFTIRLQQFFDHYLKDSACPKWMLYGIPAKDKGIDDGLQLVYEKDKNGKWLTPKEGGLLTDDEKKKVEALKKRIPITIKLN